MGAQADVLATSLGPYAQAFLQIGNRAGQAGGPVDEMVDQHDPIIPRRPQRQIGAFAALGCLQAVQMQSGHALGPGLYLAGQAAAPYG